MAVAIARCRKGPRENLLTDGQILGVGFCLSVRGRRHFIRWIRATMPRVDRLSQIPVEITHASFGTMVYTVGSGRGVEGDLTTQSHLDDGAPPVRLTERCDVRCPAIGIPHS